MSGFGPRVAVLRVIAALFVFAGTQVDGAPVEQLPEKGGFTRSMGIPSPWKKYAGLEMEWYRPTGEADAAGHANVGLLRYLGNPVVGMAALGGEVYGGPRGGDVAYGVRAHLHIPSLFVAAGVDYDLKEDEADLVLRLDVSGRRSGIVGAGSSITLRWLPTRDHTFGLGLTLPLGDPHAGRTRPQRDSVELDKRRPGRLEEEGVDPGLAALLEGAIEDLRERANWVVWLSQPFHEEKGGDAHAAMAKTIEELRAHIERRDSRFPEGHTAEAEVRAYHTAIERAFSIAISGRALDIGEGTDKGREVAAQARAHLLDDVVLPYNYLFGQVKTPDTLLGSLGVAQASFVRDALLDSGVPPERATATFYVYQTLCDLVEEARATLHGRWGDSRLVWLPLQLGLRPEDHDTQAELDAILERSTREEFARGNHFWYVVNEEFQYELGRSVRVAEDYHVVWIHDIAGLNHDGKPDSVSFGQTVNYLQALIEAVRQYDQRGRIPVYMVFIDQHYFEVNGGALWLRLLQRPLDHKLRLPKAFTEKQAEIERLQDELRIAVAESVMLQVERSQYGEEWLENRIKVHVSVTNPSDFSFTSQKIIGKFPIADNNMRDHRKIVFYDITERSPYRGMALFTGMGVGEHYVGPEWEDRAVMIQGPGALQTKKAARRLLLNQGFHADEIPHVLRVDEKPESYNDLVSAELVAMERQKMGSPADVLQLHNGTGFTPKPVNVAKAILYSLMPAGSVIKVPDSLWQSYVYASLLAGSSLRGCKSVVIMPTKASAPSSGSLQMARAHGLAGRLLAFNEGMGGVIEAAGGLFRVGLYSPEHGVGDLGARFAQAFERRPEWWGQLFPENAELDVVARGVTEQLESLDYVVEPLAGWASGHTPKLHLKANYFSSHEAWFDLMAHPGWAALVHSAVPFLVRQRAGEAEERNVRDIPEALQEAQRGFIGGYLGALTAEERENLVLYLTVGSTNMDYRSQVMNGEVMVVCGGLASLSGAIDFWLVSGVCEWPETQEELDSLLPPPGGFTRRLADLIRLGL